MVALTASARWVRAPALLCIAALAEPIPAMVAVGWWVAGCRWPLLSCRALLLESVILVLLVWPLPPAFGLATLLAMAVCHLACVGSVSLAWSGGALLMFGLYRFEHQPIVLAAFALLGAYALAIAWLAYLRTRRYRARSQRYGRYLPDSLRARLQRRLQALHLRPLWCAVAFVDVAGFTRLCADADTEALGRLVSRLIDGVCRAADAADGEVCKFLGDGALVVFPEAQAGRRAEAVARALRFHRTLCVELADEPALRLRCGISSGLCAMGDWGSEARLDYTVIGPAVNLAARLQQGAQVGRALMCGASAGLLRGHPNAGLVGSRHDHSRPP